MPSGIDIALMAVGGAGATILAPYVVAGVGFTSGGVALGSMAAAWQSTLGNVAAHTMFASLQSVGAAGIGVKGIALATTAGAAATGGVTKVVKMFI